MSQPQAPSWPPWPENASNEQIHQVLLEASKTGGQRMEAVETHFYEVFFNPVLAVVTRQWGGLSDIERYDAATQAFLEFFQGGIDQFKPAKGTLLTFLTSRAILRCMDRGRSRGRKQEIDEITATDITAASDDNETTWTPKDKASSPDVEPEANEILRTFSESIQDPAKRQIFQLYYIEGKTVQHISESLGIPKSTVYRVINAFEEDLKEWMKRNFPEVD